MKFKGSTSICILLLGACSSPTAERTARILQPDLGTDITAQGTPSASVSNPTGAANRNIAVIADGVFPAVGTNNFSLEYSTYNGSLQSDAWFAYTFASPQSFGGLVWQDGQQPPNNNGGWYVSGPTIQVLNAGTWSTVAGVNVSPAYAGHDGQSYETYTFTFPTVSGTAIRVDGQPGGTGGQSFINAGEVRVYAASMSSVDSGPDATLDATVQDSAPEAEASVDSQPEAETGVEASSDSGLLTPGLWVNITPSQLSLPASPPPFGTAWVELDPSNPQTIYLTADTQGLWKTTNSGVTWSQVGSLDSPIAVLVDPGNSQHLYATEGVRGNMMGFWVSNDGGSSWAQPAGWLSAEGSVGGPASDDVTQMDADPSDFCHILVSPHQAWTIAGGSSSGVFESRDCGASWLVHLPPGNLWSSGSKGVHFLYNPATCIGNASTWLVTDDNGFWRTSNAGASWTEVVTTGSVHGGGGLYFSPTGYLYAGALNYPLRSHDNGLTWQGLTALGTLPYYTVIGDGTTLFTQTSFTGVNNTGGLEPYKTSPETDGLTWSTQTGGQTFSDGPFRMQFDAVSRIVYSANWDSGLWALKE